MNEQGNENRWSDRLRSHPAWIVALLSLAASVASLGNGFAYDDVRAIVEDNRFHSLQTIWQVFNHTYWLPRYGGSLYRPLTSFFFALQWIAGRGSALPFHVVSILLYAAVSISVYKLGRQLFNPAAALIGAAIFAVHPLHVEAVANIVGQAELGAALFVVVAISRYISWRQAGEISNSQIAALCAMYSVALMFKEHAIVLPAMLCAAELLPSRLALSGKDRIRQVLRFAIPMAAVGIAFVVIRTSVIGNVMGAGDEAPVFAGQAISVRFFTMIPVILEWIRLFLWPASLSADYSAPRIDISTSFTAAMVPAIAVAAGFFVIAVRLRKEHPGITFAFAISCIALLIPSNLVVVTGFVLAERALFLPSVGVALLLGAAAARIVSKVPVSMRRVSIAVASLAMVAGIARSATRDVVWKDNLTLFRQTAEDVPNSWRSHMMLGELLASQGKGEGLLEMRLGVKLSPPTELAARWITARRLQAAGHQADALPYYAEAMAIDSTNARIRQDAAYCLAQLGRMSEAVAVAKGGLRITPGNPLLTQFLLFADSAQRAGTSVVAVSAQ